MRRIHWIGLSASILAILGVTLSVLRPDPQAEMFAAIPGFRFLNYGKWPDPNFPSSWSEASNYRRDGADLKAQTAHARRVLTSPRWRELPVQSDGAVAFVLTDHSPIKPYIVRYSLTRPLRRQIADQSWMLRMYPKDGGVGVDLVHSVDR